MLWSENIICISFLRKVVRFVLWPSVWSTVITVPCVFEKNVVFSSDSVLDETVLTPGRLMRLDEKVCSCLGVKRRVSCNQIVDCTLLRLMR